MRRVSLCKCVVCALSSSSLMLLGLRKLYFFFASWFPFRLCQYGVLDGEAAGLEGGEELVPSCLLLLSGSSTSALVPDLIVYLGGFFFFF